MMSMSSRFALLILLLPARTIWQRSCRTLILHIIPVISIFASTTVYIDSTTLLSPTILAFYSFTQATGFSSSLLMRLTHHIFANTFRSPVPFRPLVIASLRLRIKFSLYQRSNSTLGSSYDYGIRIPVRRMYPIH